MSSGPLAGPWAAYMVLRVPTTVQQVLTNHLAGILLMPITGLVFIAGIVISGIVGGVMPGQWKFQVGPVVGIAAADQLWVARYILERITEIAGVGLSFDPKAIQGHSNGAGSRTYYRTDSMGGVEQNEIKIKEAIEKLRLRHKEHLPVFYKSCLTGWHETAEVSSRDALKPRACVRLNHLTEHNGKDTASDMDPYTFTSMIAETTILWKPT